MRSQSAKTSYAEVFLISKRKQTEPAQERSEARTFGSLAASGVSGTVLVTTSSSASIQTRQRSELITRRQRQSEHERQTLHKRKRIAQGMGRDAHGKESTTCEIAQLERQRMSRLAISESAKPGKVDGPRGELRSFSTASPEKRPCGANA